MICRAIVIGVNEYADPEIRNLECAVADALALKDELDGFGFDVRLLENPTEDEVETALKESLFGMGPGDVFLFSFSGHGFAAEGGQDLLFCADDLLRKLRYRKAGLPFEMLREETEPASCHRVFLLDACRSDFQVGLKGNDASTKDLSPLREMAITGDGDSSIAILRSCQAFQCSREIASTGHGLFTLALLDVLQGMRKNAERIVVDHGLLKRIAKRMRTIVRMHGIQVDQQPEFQNSGLSAVVLDPFGNRVGVQKAESSVDDDVEVPDYSGRNDARMASERQAIIRANGFLKAGEYEKAFGLLQSVKENCEVQTTLGAMMLQGLGCGQNRSAGLNLLRMAAKNGSSRACYQLYYALIKTNRNEAIAFLTKAADRDDKDALFVLADEYRRSGDAVRMEHCLMRGARLGDSRAIRLLKNQRERIGL